MKSFRTFLCILAFGFAMQVQAQEDTTVATNDSVTIEMTEESEMMVAGMNESDYYEASEQRFKDRMTAMEVQEAYVSGRESEAINGRIWIVVILVLGGLISGGIGFLAMKGAEAAMKPEIFHLWPNSSNGATSIDVTIPAHTFMCELIVKDTEKNVVFSTNVDNAATKLDYDFSDLEAGKYKIQLVGEETKSNTVDFVRL